jgi:hypothetical protein
MKKLKSSNLYCIQAGNNTNNHVTTTINSCLWWTGLWSNISILRGCTEIVAGEGVPGLVNLAIGASFRVLVDNAYVELNQINKPSSSDDKDLSTATS